MWRYLINFFNPPAAKDFSRLVTRRMNISLNIPSVSSNEFFMIIAVAASEQGSILILYSYSKSQTCLIACWLSCIYEEWVMLYVVI